MYFKIQIQKYDKHYNSFSDLFLLSSTEVKNNDYIYDSMII